MVAAPFKARKGCLPPTQLLGLVLFITFCLAAWTLTFNVAMNKHNSMTLLESLEYAISVQLRQQLFEETADLGAADATDGSSTLTGPGANGTNGIRKPPNPQQQMQRLLRDLVQLRNVTVRQHNRLQDLMQQVLLQQQQQQLFPALPSLQQLHRSQQMVDIVYIWSNSSEPQLQHELQQHLQGDAQHGTAQHYHQSGFEGLRYSLRSVDQFMPWFRHLFIVTNGQVPRWLNTSHPRVSVVPHSTIFHNASHLPTFNPHAVQANIVNIPGLSEAFVVLDEDWFLTAPWYLPDFVGPDGAQTLTGTELAKSAMRLNRTDATYIDMLRVMDAVFSHHFGPWPRFDPSKSPHYMQLYWLKQLRAQLHAEFEATSASRFRSPGNLLLAPGYQWYVSQFQPGAHRNLPPSHASASAATSLMLQPYTSAAVDDFDEQLRAGNTKAVALSKVQQYKEGRAAEKAAVAAAFAAQLQSTGHSGTRLAQVAATYGQLLQRDWTRCDAKSVALQADAAAATNSAVQQLMAAAVKAFLQAKYPHRGRFELPGGAHNGCSARLRHTHFGQLPTQADYADACHAAA